jgi:PERQ amino acid-rich with GYF domain-containing protein
MPDGMEHASPITQETAIKPLAFVSPDAEEEVYEYYLMSCKRYAL